jgi:hypothetical protein
LLLLVLGVALRASAFSGRALSPLRFSDHRVGGDSVSIATDGNRFLVVQTDALSTLTVYGRLITPQGVAGLPFFIGVGQVADVFWNGRAYIVILQTPFASNNKSISAATVPRNGVGVTSVERVWLEAPPSVPVLVAWNGRRAILSSSDRFALLDADGHPLGKPILRGSGSYTQIIGTNDGFVAVSDYRHLVRIRDDGVVDPKTTDIPDGFGLLVHDENRTVYVYSGASSTNAGSDIYMLQIRADGSLGKPIRLFKNNYFDRPGAVALVGQRLIVGGPEFHGGPYTAALDVFVRAFDIGANGQPTAVTSDVQLTSTGPYDRGRNLVKIACNTGTCAYKFDLYYPGTVRILAHDQLKANVRPNEGELPLDIPHALTEQSNAAIAAGANGYLTAWNERDENGQPQTTVSLIAPDGRHADGPGLRLGKTGPFFDPPRVAWGNDQWLVAFSNKAIRVDAQGRNVDPQAFSTGIYAAKAVAWSGSSWIVIGEAAEGRLSSVVVRPNGTVGDVHTIFTISSDDSYGRGFTALAWGNNGYVLAFRVTTVTNTCCTQLITDQLLVTRLSEEGIPVEPAPIPVSTAVDYDSVVSIASRPGATLISWSSSPDVVLIEVLPGSPLRLSGAPVRLHGSKLHDLAADDRGGFALLCSRNDSLIYTYAWTAGELDILRLTPNAIVYDEQRTSAVTDEARFACREDDCAVVYSELSQDSHNTRRAQVLFARDFKPTPPPASPRVELIRNGDQANVTWDLLPDALGYIVEVTSGIEEGFHLVEATMTGINGMPLESSVISVRVRAWNAGGVSPATTVSPVRRRAVMR